MQCLSSGYAKFKSFLQKLLAKAVKNQNYEMGKSEEL